MIASQRQRTNLQKTELGRLFSAGQTHGKFDLDGIAQRVFPGSHQQLQNRRQREDAVLEHRSEGHNTRPGTAQSVVDSMIVGRISRGNRV